MLPKDLGLEHEEPVWPISDTNRAARHQEELCGPSSFSDARNLLEKAFMEDWGAKILSCSRKRWAALSQFCPLSHLRLL